MGEIFSNLALITPHAISVQIGVNVLAAFDQVAQVVEVLHLLAVCRQSSGAVYDVVERE
ncbi:hypothetical protein G5B31_12225 [Rhodobacter sp. SGA-6-6]|uniref:hypothetical protein n=1 Tax=Rhodobacter sp. SGA-6-6 TaxID=2710882 RepID=UPI0013ED5632|nr:hypothetical protein [Rhodobacter sp. SGA-6-6]NGM46303.1 hypothetical protein [Rhodobacter sp. SGA-6-6]